MIIADNSIPKSTSSAQMSDYILLIIAMFFFDRHYALANPSEESTHVRFFTPKMLKNLLEKFNFKIISVTYQGRFYPLYKTMTIIGKK